MKTSFDSTDRVRYKGAATAGSQYAYRESPEMPGPIRQADAPNARGRRRRTLAGASTSARRQFRRILVIPASAADAAGMVSALRLLSAPEGKITVLHSCDHSLRTGSVPVSAGDVTCPRCVGHNGQTPVDRPLSDDLWVALREQPADLIVSGLPKTRRIRKKSARRLLRLAPCSLCVIPAGSGASVRRICVAVDSASISRKAVKVAVGLAKTSGLKEILCVHVYSVPAGYMAVGKRFDEVAFIMRRLAERRIQELIRGVRSEGVAIRPVFELNDSPARGIVCAVERERVDMIVLGARGRRNLAAALLLPSICERVIRRASTTCLVLKDPGKGITLGQAILTM